MALITCPDCGTQHSTEAKACPKCGRPAPKQTSALTWFVLIVIVFVVASAIVGNIQQDSKRRAAAAAEHARLAKLSPEERARELRAIAEAAEERAKAEHEQEQLDLARTACKEFTKRVLHDPDAAEFGDYHTWPADEEKPGRFHVLVRLRAKNGFGALRLTEVDCHTRFDGSDWRAVSLHEVHSG